VSRGTKVARICAGCGRGYSALLVDLKRGWGKVCSQRCGARVRQREVDQERARRARKAGKPAPALLQQRHQQMAAGRLQDIETTAELRTSGPEFDFSEGVQ